MRKNFAIKASSSLIGNYKDGFQRDGNISKQVSSISVSQWAILVFWVTMCIVQFVPWPADTAEIFSTILTSLLPYFLYISSIQKKFTEVGSSLNYIILRYHLWWNVVLSLTSINQFAESVLGFLAEKWFKHTDEGCWLNCVNLVICICLPWIYLILMQYSIQYRISCCYSDCVGIH